MISDVGFRNGFLLANFFNRHSVILQLVDLFYGLKAFPLLLRKFLQLIFYGFYMIIYGNFTLRSQAVFCLGVCLG
jgi:hypothetical protein